MKKNETKKFCSHSEKTENLSINRDFSYFIKLILNVFCAKYNKKINQSLNDFFESNQNISRSLREKVLLLLVNSTMFPAKTSNKIIIRQTRKITESGKIKQNNFVRIFRFSPPPSISLHALLTKM